MTIQLKMWPAIIMWLLVALAVSFRMGRASVQSANDLIAVGFTVADDGGNEINNFDDGLPALWEHYATWGAYYLGYDNVWTSEENPFSDAHIVR